MEEKKFDVNSFIGMILIGGILLWWMNSNQPEINQNTETKSEQQINADSIAYQNNITSLPPVVNDSLKQVQIKNQLGDFAYSAVMALKEHQH